MVHGKVISFQNSPVSTADCTEDEGDITLFSDGVDEKTGISLERGLEFVWLQGGTSEEDEGLEDINLSSVDGAKEIDKAILDGKIMVKVDRPWKCDYKGCDKAFKVKSNLKRHQISHTELRPFRCPVSGCGKSYRRLDHLQSHAVVHGQDSRPFKCQVSSCGSSFSTKHHLSRHQRQIHEVERPYKCDQEDCGLSFAREYSLRKHVTTHTGKKLYPCERFGCDKSFSTSTKLRIHGRVHFEHNRWRCTFRGCEYEFPKADEMKLHLRTFHKSVCEICKKQVKDIKSLRKHMRTHDPDRIMYPCDWDNCDKYYYDKKALYKHVRAIHENIRPFACNETGCGMSFTYKHVLNNHIKSLHMNPRPHKIRKFDDNDKINRHVSKIEHLTGFGYERGRDIECTVEGCAYKFKRQYDLSRHLESKHLEIVNSVGNMSGIEM